MLKTIHLVKKKPELSFEEFKHYWLEEHVKLCKKLPGLKRYVVNMVIGSYTESRPYDGVAELDFEDEESFEKALGSPEGQVAVEHIKNFAEYVDILYAQERVVKKPRAKLTRPKKKKPKIRKKAKKKVRKPAKKRVKRKKR